jgi:colanic acid/amylovoran biosynthesis glycosyltransferase
MTAIEAATLSQRRVPEGHGAEAAAVDHRPATLLLYISVPVYRRGDELLLEDQACNGLRLWADNFERLILVVPVAEGAPPASWVPMAAAVGAAMARIEVVTVPEAYRPDRFLRALPKVVPRLRAAIGRADYLGFAIGGLFGDWGSVGAILAHRMGLPFYVWTDRVESEVVRVAARSGPWKRRVQAALAHRPMAWLERYLIRRADLGLFHGRETYETYAPWSRNPQVVHDIHIRKADHIAPEALAAKIAALRSGPLRICYMGRADQMKGPHDWIAVLERLAQAGVDFTATWLGEGTELEAMRARVAAGPLAGRVTLPGFVRDRALVAGEVRAAHLMMFCHKTPESPRCLIEALTSGTPIVGYDSAFPRDLIAAHGGGRLVPRDDVVALAQAVVDLVQDRGALAALVARAAEDGAQFDDVTVFRHRSELIRAHLPRTRQTGV